MSARRTFSVVALALAGLPSSIAGTAGNFWDDRPLKIVQTTQANFPMVLAAEGVNEGEVRAVLHVDADGRLVDYLVTAYTRREFANELAAQLPHWTYEPARKRGEAVGARTEAAFTFEARGLVLSLTPQDMFAATSNRLVGPTWTTLVCRPSELDEPVRVLHVVAPHHPGSRVSSPPTRPTVLIDFYIDTDGKTRMPVVLRAAQELYAIAAIEALVQWRFSPPMRGGHRVIARATQLFSFSDQRP